MALTGPRRGMVFAAEEPVALEAVSGGSRRPFDRVRDFSVQSDITYLEDYSAAPLLGRLAIGESSAALFRAPLGSANLGYRVLAWASLISGRPKSTKSR
jgi:hypothetical protein